MRQHTLFFDFPLDPFAVSLSSSLLSSPWESESLSEALSCFFDIFDFPFVISGVLRLLFPAAVDDDDEDADDAPALVAVG